VDECGRPPAATAGELGRGGPDDAGSGRVRSVPMASAVAAALAALGQREHTIGDDDLVFVDELGGCLDGSVLRRRYDAAPVEDVVWLVVVGDAVGAGPGAGSVRVWPAASWIVMLRRFASPVTL